MPGVITATITGIQGPGLAVTAAVYNNVATIRFDAVKGMVELMEVDGTFTQISIAAATTITVVLSAAFGNYTVTVS